MAKLTADHNVKLRPHAMRYIDSGQLDKRGAQIVAEVWR